MVNGSSDRLYDRYAAYEKGRMHKANDSASGPVTQVDKSLGHLLGRTEFETYFSTLSGPAQDSLRLAWDTAQDHENGQSASD
jgi:hypothetical protein